MMNEIMMMFVDVDGSTDTIMYKDGGMDESRTRDLLRDRQALWTN